MNGKDSSQTDKAGKGESGNAASGRDSVSYSGSGVGVHNVQERIRIYFGEEYGLTYESELEEGTTVTIEIPRLPAAQEESGRHVLNLPQAGEGEGR
ncbi:hypothetical protein D3C84_1111210 [compost metagenome]